MTPPPCAEHPDLFQPEVVTDAGTNQARAICAGCPNFEACRAQPFEAHPTGIRFGYTALERYLMAIEAMPYKDWRPAKDRPLASDTIMRLEERAYKDGDPAVVGMRRLYVEEDRAERERIISTYTAWIDAQHYRADYRHAQIVADKVTDALARSIETGRKRRVPPGLRPACPNGHERKDMYRVIRRANKPTEETWCCYKCRAKVTINAIEPAPARAE